MSTGDAVAIVGAGTTTSFGEFPDRSTVDLTQEALRAALNDAGVHRDEVDGLVTNTGLDYPQLCEHLGLELDFVGQSWMHGEFVAPSLQHGVMAIREGLAETVVAGGAIKFNEYDQIIASGGTSMALTDSIRFAARPWYGLFSQAAGVALVTRYYMERYGATTEDLAHVPVTLREHASLNPTAQYTDPIDVESHQDSRWIVDPLRLYDCAAVTDGGAYVVLTTESNARSLEGEAVTVAGMRGLSGSRNEESFLFARPGLGVRSQREYQYEPGPEVQRIYDIAGVARSDVDALYTYDAFSPAVWFALERWGFCPPGTANEFARDGRIAIDGDLPVNTNGGLLSDGHIVGWNHIVEMYRQVCGRCGPRQVDGASVVQWAGPLGDSFILQGVQDA